MALITLFSRYWEFFTRFSDTLTSDLKVEVTEIQTRPGLLVNTPMLSIWNLVRWSLLHRRDITRTDTYGTQASYSQFLFSYRLCCCRWQHITNIELNSFQYHDSDNVAPLGIFQSTTGSSYSKDDILLEMKTFTQSSVQKVWATTNFFIHRFNYQGFSYQLFY